MGWKDVLKRFSGSEDPGMSGAQKMVDQTVVLPGQEVLPHVHVEAGNAVGAEPSAAAPDDLTAIMARDAAIKLPRAAFDAYPTPTPFAEGMTRRVAEILPYPPAMIVEPSAGVGVFVRAARTAWPTAPVIAVEIQGECAPKLYEAGASIVSIGNWTDVTEAVQRQTLPAPWLILGNPPYLEAAEHVEAALRIMQHGEWLAFLLRINFFGSNGRRAFWARKKDRLRYLIPFTQRPKFRNNKSDATEYGCFIWQKGWTGNAEILPNMDIAEELVREKEEG